MRSHPFHTLQSQIETLLMQLGNTFLTPSAPRDDSAQDHRSSTEIAKQNLELRFKLMTLQQELLDLTTDTDEEVLNKYQKEFMNISMKAMKSLLNNTTSRTLPNLQTSSSLHDPSMTSGSWIREEPFSEIPSVMIFQEISQLNSQVKQRKQQCLQQMAKIDELYEQLASNGLAIDLLTNIEHLVMTPLDKCHLILTNPSTTKFSIKNEKDIQLFDSLFKEFQQVKDQILQGDCIPLLNDFIVKTEEHVETISNFLLNFQICTQSMLHNEIHRCSNTLSNDRLKDFELAIYLTNWKQDFYSELNLTSWTTNHSPTVQELSKTLRDLALHLEEGHSEHEDLSWFNDLLQQVKRSLVHEYSLLSQHFINANTFPHPLFEGLVSCMVYYQELKSIANALVQESIPLIFQKHKYFENARELIQNFSHMQQRLEEINKQKRNIERVIKKIQLEIEGLREELLYEKNLEQQEVLKKEISEQELKILTHKEQARQLIHESNEIRLTLLKLRQLGFSEVFSHTLEEMHPILGIPELSPDFFKQISQLSGWSGNHSVFEATDFQSKRYIIKQYQVRDHKDLDKLKKELKILQKIKHRNIVTLEGYYLETNTSHRSISIYVVMPFYNGGDLKQFISRQKQHETIQLFKLDMIFWERLWRQLLLAIQHIHSSGVIHCDIKPENIFIEIHQVHIRVILGDFDVSMDTQNRTLNMVTRTCGSSGGTLEYLAPEIVKLGQKASFMSDMYAFGKTVKNVMLQELKEYPSLHDLVTQCLSEDPSKRPSSSEALANAFFTVDTLPKEIEFQNKLKQVEIDQQVLEKKQSEISELLQNLEKQRQDIQRQVFELENERQLYQDETQQQRMEIQHQIDMLQKKEKTLQELDEKLRNDSKSQLTVSLPSYWKYRLVNSPQHGSSSPLMIVEVTKHMKDIIQELLDFTCRASTLGSGRDQQVRMTYTQLVVHQIFRIENPTLFSLYSTRKQQLMAYNDPANPIHVQTHQVSHSNAQTWIKQCGLDLSCNEVYLWHGTKPNVVKSITEHGFDERLSNLSGLFGAGIYFAENCSKSDQYCTPDSNQEYSMFLSRVVLGRQIYQAGASTSQSLGNQRRPPQIPNTNGRVYDSVIGKSNASSSAYTEFIVYDRNQCYPEFLIKYKRQ
ncbi:hypothetical protein C9374_005202 [Naegleria lovaniensis]|uniref:Poly [ADP-ribose] polymerase n=1 Tax=Naegleria lovaniensis TaxID=51637 RepID=A0AA88KIV4_NAELO|nr:uncharacterized protein C9374_005202 [Naegleria lovaniensis]KAG2382622.1 hypothetical protein C9374_005202 [Naegleria lovaniensis]